MPVRIFALAFGLLLAGLVMASPAQAQSGFDRVGGDYLKFEIRTGDPAVCAARCERDSRCRAWSFSYPRTENALGDLLAQEQGAAAQRRQMLRVGRARGWRDCAAQRARSNSASTASAATIAISICRRIRPAPPATPPAKPTTNAAPGPMCGPAISAPARAVISRTRLRARAASRAAFRAWCG